MPCTIRPALRSSLRCRQPTSNQHLVFRREFARSQHTSSNIHNEVPKPKRSSLRGIAAALFFFGTGWVLNDTFHLIGFSSPQSLNDSTFTPFSLTKKETVSSTSAIFTLSQSHIPPGTFDEWSKKGVWSIEIKQPQLQIARAYTPLPPLNGSDPDALRLLVRRERRGEVSGYLHRRPQGADVEVRGPAIEYELPQEVDQVVFLAGGTGVAPAIQVAHALGDKARVSVLWANRQREDCVGGLSDDPITPGWYASFTRLFSSESHHSTATSGEKSLIVRQLDALKQTNKSLTVDYFVDEESTHIHPQNVRNAIAQTSSQTPTSEQGRKVIFVSGPEGFINYWAGPKQWFNGREVQGVLGGALAHMDLRGWQVVKL
ncbi:hypothetical protein D6D10_07083 [Aureobasidium pullulans]|uniref:FAD-binding FR-type domain-containing protein n=1 Tax=Aureobasidium pullulans TaxID=5580 RepID=A0A4S9EQF9_AURPU|nr:hypothetical protein D6D10_07083 [Aureobasidium pullulans]